MDQVVEKGGGAALESTVADELGDPRNDVDTERELENEGRVLEAQVFGVCSASQAKRSKGEACNWLKEQVQCCVCYGGDCAKIQVEVRDAEPAWEVDEGSCVGCLNKVSLKRCLPPTVRSFMYHGKRRDQDQRHANAVNEHIDRVVVVGTVLREIY